MVVLGVVAVCQLRGGQALPAGSANLAVTQNTRQLRVPIGQMLVAGGSRGLGHGPLWLVAGTRERDRLPWYKLGKKSKEREKILM